MSIDTIFPADNSTQFLDLLIQLGTIFAFGITGIGFLIRHSNKQIDKKMDEKLKPVTGAMDDVQAKLAIHAQTLDDKMKQLTTHLDNQDKNFRLLDDKIEEHFISSARFIATTETRLSNMEKGTKTSTRKRIGTYHKHQ